MMIQVIDGELRTGVCAICHKRKPTITVSIKSKGSPIITTEDWCLKDFHTLQDKTLTLR
jgi:hypothetical protein